APAHGAVPGRRDHVDVLARRHDRARRASGRGVRLAGPRSSDRHRGESSGERRDRGSEYSRRLRVRRRARLGGGGPAALRRARPAPAAGRLDHRLQTSITGLSLRAPAATTESIEGSRNRCSAVSRAGPRSVSTSALLTRTTMRAFAGAPLRPPSGWARSVATISGVIAAPGEAPVSAPTRSGR